VFQLGYLDPKVILNADHESQERLWMSIARNCGWIRQKGIAEIPKNLSLGHHIKSGPGKLRLLERIRMAQGRLCLVDPPVVASGGNWVEKADYTPWVTNLITDDPEILCRKSKVSTETFWDLETQNHFSCRWDDEGLQQTLRILVRRTRRIDVLDRYLVKARALVNLQRILLSLVDARCMEVQRPELVIHFSPDDSDRSFANGSDSAILNRLTFNRPMPFKLRLLVWQKEGLHSRYFLGDQGGMTVGESLTWPLSEPVDFTLMNAHMEKRSKYSPHSEHGKKYLIREIRCH